MVMPEPKRDILNVKRLLAAALLYFALARIAGAAIAEPPGYASPLWPAAGVAMALCVRWRGFAPALGIMLGSALNNGYIAWSAGHAVGRAFSIGSLIGLGAAAQSVAGGGLLRRYWTLTGPGFARAAGLMALACIANAAWGPLVLLCAGLGGENLAWTMFTWWVGDFIGCCVVVMPSLVLLDGGAHGEA